MVLDEVVEKMYRHSPCALARPGEICCTHADDVGVDQEYTVTVLMIASPGPASVTVSVRGMRRRLAA